MAFSAKRFRELITNSEEELSGFPASQRALEQALYSLYQRTLAEQQSPTERKSCSKKD